MRVDDLWKFCVPGVKSKAPVHFKTIQNTSVAVDISCIPLVSTTDFTLGFTTR